MFLKVGSLRPKKPSFQKQSLKRVPAPKRNTLYVTLTAIEKILILLEN